MTFAYSSIVIDFIGNAQENLTNQVDAESPHRISDNDHIGNGRILHLGEERNVRAILSTKGTEKHGKRRKILQPQRS